MIVASLPLGVKQGETQIEATDHARSVQVCGKQRYCIFATLPTLASRTETIRYGRQWRQALKIVENRLAQFAYIS